MPVTAGLAQQIVLPATQNSQYWTLPGSGFRPQGGGLPGDPASVEALMRNAMPQKKWYLNGVGAPQLDVSSPEHVLAQLQRVDEMLDAGELEAAAARLDEVRKKADPLLNDGRPPEQQSDMLKALRSLVMNAGVELAMRRGDHDTVIKSTLEHLKMLPLFDDPHARLHEIRTVVFLTEALKEKQRSTECIPWLRHVVSLVKTKELPPSDALAGDLSQMATVARRLQQMDDAGFLAEKAVKLIESSATPGDSSQIMGLTRIGQVHLEQDKLLEAEAVLLKARKLGEEEKARPVVMVTLLNTLGQTQERIYQFQGGKDRLDQAEKYYQEAYDLMQKQEGITSLAASYRLGNLAGVQEMKGNAAQALKMRKEAWDIVEKELGPNHEGTLGALISYIQAMKAMGRLPDALKLCQDLVQRSQVTLGGLHPRVADAQHLLGRTHMQLGQFNEAEKCYERAAGIRERALGTDHGDTAKSYFNLGLIREAKEDYTGATAYFEHVLKIDRKAHGDDSEVVADDTSALARTLMKEGRYDEALAKVNENLAWIGKKLGQDHLVMASALLALAAVEEGRERFAEAEKIYQRVVTIREKSLGEEHALVAEGHARYAMFLITRNKLTMAAGELRIASASFARHRQREGTHGENLSSCLDLYVQIMRKLQHDPSTIEKHVRLLETGVNPEEEKGRTSI
ncbi:MAG TPA: tetratricopeptide repeat protein [Prosthecobacter sp.]